MNKKEKEKRKAYVKEQRQKLIKNPKGFLQTEIIKPTLQYWKTQPLHAFFTFFKWALIMYLSFALVQAINNDLIYCDATNDEYDGKLMLQYNRFVQYYNEKAIQLQKGQYTFTNNTNLQNNYKQIINTEADYEKQKQKNTLIKQFNQENKMYCSYDLKRWIKEPKTYTLKTLIIGYLKIITKQS